MLQQEEKDILEAPVGGGPFPGLPPILAVTLFLGGTLFLLLLFVLFLRVLVVALAGGFFAGRGLFFGLG